MHKGFTRTTLGVVGAALLSGSVFAAGPTLKNLPTVIITDKAKDGTFTCGAPFDGGPGVLTAATENRYMFTDAIDLVDYTLPGDSTLDQVNYLFEEFASDANGAEGAARTGGSRAIAINGTLAYDAGGTIDRDAVLNNAAGDLQNDNVLTFVDQIRSGGDGTNPGPDPGGAFTDYALLKFYVASTNPGTQSAEVSVKSMSVITTNDTACDEGDTLSVATSIFTLEKCVDDFVGWFDRNSFAGLSDVSQNLAANATGFTGTWTANLQPVRTPTPTGSIAGFDTNAVPITESPTDALGIFTHASPGNTGTTDATRAPQFAVWQSWRRDIEAAPKTTVPISADTVYMIRWTVQVQAATQSATSPQIPDVRFRVGEASALGLGQAHDVLPGAPGANGIVGAGVQEHRSYYYAPVGTPSGAEIGFMFDAFDFYQGTGGGTLFQGASDYGLDLQKIEVFSFDRADLDGETIELNAGAASLPATADGTVAPSGATAFTRFDIPASQTSGDWEFRPGTFVSTGTSNRNPSGVFAADKLSMSLVAGNHNAIGSWDTRGFVVRQDPVNFLPDSTADEIVSGIPNEKILFVDAWLSSPQGSTTNNHLPVLRVGFQTDAYGETGFTSAGGNISQGRTAYIEFRGWNRTDALDVNVAIAPTNGLATSPKRYTAVMEPMIRTGSTIDVRPFVQFWSFPTNFAPTFAFEDDRLDAGTIDINRVVITSYDRPNLPDSAVCP